MGLKTTKPACVHHEIWIKLANQLAQKSGGPEGSGVSLVIVGTDETRADFLEQSQRLRREIALYLGNDAARTLPITFLRYDVAALRGATGQQDDPFWALFEELRRVLSPEPLELRGDLTHIQGDRDTFTKEAAQNIIVDVTHGFRAVPIVAVAVLQFVLAERRSVLRQAELPLAPAMGNRGNRSAIVDAAHHILYAAQEDVPRGQVVPVWNLTPLMAAPRWAAALDAFMCYGRADDLQALGKEEASRRTNEAHARKASPEQLVDATIVERFGDAAAALADDLAFIRLRDLFTRSAKHMKELLDGRDGEQLATQIPPLRGALGRLQQWVAPLISTNVLRREGVDAIAHLAMLYGLLQRFAEQAVAVREGLVSHYALQVGHHQAEPGLACSDPRRRIDSKWGRAIGVQHQPSTAENLTLSEKAKNPRNDLIHGGVNDDPSTADELRKQFKKWTREFQQLVASVRDP